MLQANLPAIPSVLSHDWDHCIKTLGSPPLFIKPRVGSGSKGVAVIYDGDDFRYFTKKLGTDFMVQKFIGSEEQEYTVGVFGFGDGTSIAPIIFQRRLSAAGNTQYAKVVDQPLIAEMANKISVTFKPLGPTNYQFRIDDGVAYLLEINPRFSSSTSLRTAFGYNEATMAVDFYLHGIKPTPPNVVKGQAWRYFADIVVT